MAVDFQYSRHFGNCRDYARDVPALSITAQLRRKDVSSQFVIWVYQRGSDFLMWTWIVWYTNHAIQKLKKYNNRKQILLTVDLVFQSDCLTETALNLKNKQTNKTLCLPPCSHLRRLQQCVETWPKKNNHRTKRVCVLQSLFPKTFFFKLQLNIHHF